ncbi:hypothetical protein GCM10007981_03280 [Thermocladium modestius]|uniref:Sjogrens syndrome scleroderma autoantigen 1 n=1 Tax=Thermocladium modestius TaxID=62609 RepID=A0A830GU09_9CREN|nr:Sjogren's syndrome/scleroderma autoantigen 1 family protein [Thermocladium modestius]GGP19469.1 hypothetical protein GCM10007981_03280 [Thermocladium modestius]
MASSDPVIRRMAELMREGAALTQYACPTCGTPLLRLKSGKYYCARCDKEVVLVKSEEEERSVSIRYGLVGVRDVVYGKIMAISRTLESSREVDDVDRSTAALINLLRALDLLNHLIGGEQEKHAD